VGSDVPRRGRDALLLVDVQRDFLPGGALAVRDGDAVVPVLDQWVRAFHRVGARVYASRDWHPANHCSFRSRGGPWPPHCIAGTPGAEFAPGLTLPPDVVIVSKAVEPQRDAYSALDGTGLGAALQAAGVERLWIGGLATDYCVRATVLDALQAGFQVRVLAEGVRAVERLPGDGARALAAMHAAGAVLRSGPAPGGPRT